MNTEIKERIYITDPTQEIVDWCENNLVVRNPTYDTLKRMGKEDTIRYRHIPESLKLYSIRRGDTYILPFGCLKGIWKFIKNDNFSLAFNNNTPISIANQKATIEYYDYQEQAIDNMVKEKGGVLVSPAGSGKTYMGTEIIRRIGKKTLWLCHTSDLLKQAEHDMKTLYPNIQIGLTTKGQLQIGEDVTISTIQTMVQIDPALYENEFDVVICDECAHVAGSATQMKMFQKVVERIPARYKYGLTATPMRSDGLEKTMYAIIGMSPKGEFEYTYKVDKEKVKTIVAEHRRVDIKLNYSIQDLANMLDNSGMIVYHQLIAFLAQNKQRNDIIIENIIKCVGEGRKQVVLCNTVEHCENLVEELKTKGIAVELCIGKTSSKRREQILTQKIHWDVLVATYSLLKEGVSIKELDTLHLTTPIKDKAMVIQCAGRIERYKENKKQPIVYDYVDVEIPYCERAFSKRKSALKRRV